MKNKIRKEYLEIRKQINDKETKSNTIFNTIINLKIYKDSQVIALYKSMIFEVNASKLIEHSLNNKRIVLLPKVDKDKMNFHKINKTTKYFKSQFGVEEPLNNEIYEDKIDLIITPLVVFDENCNRIGYGKGYYDKYLNKDIFNTIGIAYEEQKYNGLIPIDKQDKKLDVIVTEKKVYSKKIIHIFR